MFFMDHSHAVLGTALLGKYSGTLIIMSVFIAILSSFTAFGTSERQYNSSQKSHKIAWNLFGAVSMGLGIWAMNFIGMLALSLPIPITYNVLGTLLSVIPAICACSVVLWIMTQQEYSIKRLVLAGVLLGAGIGLMHYIGIAAIRVNAEMVHNMFSFYVSFLVATLLAIMALKVSQDGVKYTQYQIITKRHVVSAIVMGIASSAMHYIAMASVNFYPQAESHALSGMSSSALAILIVSVVFVILLFAIAVPSFLRYKKVTERLDDNLKRLSIALSAANQGWYDFNPQTEIVYVSDSYARLLGHEPEEFDANISQWKENVHPDDIAKTAGVSEEILRLDGPLVHEYRRKTKSGEWIWLKSVSEVVERGENNKPLRVIGIQTDITESKKQQDILEKMAHYDGLTQLPNRALFAIRFSEAAEQCKENGTLLAICFLDLDNFKPVNDDFGHDIGDQLLIAVAERITSHLREHDTVSRQGGDEFTLLLRDFESFEECEIMLKRIQESLARPYLINDYSHHISASIGVTLYPQDAADIDTLIRHADQAMYQAKISGRNCYHLFDISDTRRTIEKQSQLAEIEAALSKNEFNLYYQPKVDMAAGNVFGAEALVRWNHPDKGLLSPETFLPVMEGTDLEIKFGNWIINDALRQLDEWQQLGVKLEVSVNISSHHIQSESFLAQLDSALSAWPKVDSSCLQIEILESSALGDLSAVSNVIKICRDVLGLPVALDDFGTSYSSLTHLRSLPARVIKIDQSFVRDMLEDPSDYAIIEGVIALASSFNREVIAEGVETVAQGEMLILMGCNIAQGYCIARPMSAYDIPAWLEHYQVNQQWVSIATRDWSDKQKRLKLFELGVTSWHKRFMKNIQGSSDDIDYWPIMEKRKCSCGLWIKREKQAEEFDISWLNGLDEAHNKLHELAGELKNHYLKAGTEQLSLGIESFNKAYDSINLILAEQ